MSFAISQLTGGFWPVLSSACVLPGGILLLTRRIPRRTSGDRPGSPGKQTEPSEHGYCLRLSLRAKRRVSQVLLREKAVRTASLSWCQSARSLCGPQDGMTRLVPVREPFGCDGLKEHCKPVPGFSSGRTGKPSRSQATSVWS